MGQIRTKNEKYSTSDWWFDNYIWNNVQQSCPHSLTLKHSQTQSIKIRKFIFYGDCSQMELSLKLMKYMEQDTIEHIVFKFSAVNTVSV